MPATVNVNSLTVVHKDSGGISICFPDVCKTPSPAGPIPIPYPNIAKSADTDKGSSSVKVDGNPIMLQGSVYSTSTGDEAGSAGGIISSVTKGNAEFINYSFDVQVEGKNVCRLLDPMAQNKSPCTGNGMGPANLQPPLVVLPLAAAIKDVKVFSGRVVKILFQSGIELWTVKSKANAQLPPSGDAHWETGKKERYAAIYPRQGAGGSADRKLQVTVKIRSEVGGQATLAAKTPDVEVEGKASVSVSKTDTDVVFDCKLTKLPGTVRRLKGLALPWTLEIGGETKTINPTTSTLYIVDEPPKPVSWSQGARDAKNWYDFVVDWSCNWADGKTGARNVFDAVWAGFSDGSKARVPHATGWSYWKTDDPAQGLLECKTKPAGQKGWSCRAICHFFMMSVALHGLDCREAIPEGVPERNFMVAHWDFTGAGDQFQVAGTVRPGLYYAGDWRSNRFSQPQRKSDHPGWTLDATRTAAVGQGQPNPPLSFGNHWIALFTAPYSGYFDTSYGSGPHASGAAYKPKAISGWEDEFAPYPPDQAKGRKNQASLTIVKEGEHTMIVHNGSSKT